MVQAITPEEILALRRRKTQAQQQPTEDRNPLPGFVRDIGGAIGDWVGETAMPALGQAWQAIGDSPAGPVFGEFWDSAQRLADTPTGQLVGKGLSAADIAIRGAGTVGMTALSQGLVPGGAPTALGVPSIFGDWGPRGDPVEALKAFAAQARQGKIDEGITAAHDVLDAGPGFWGAGEIASAALPTGAPYAIGTKLLSSAPRLAHTISRVAPAAQQAQVARGAETALRGTAAAMRAPWQAEEWVGSQLMRPVRAGIERIRGTTPPVEEPIRAQWAGATPWPRQTVDAVDVALGQGDVRRPVGQATPQPTATAATETGTPPPIVGAGGRSVDETLEELNRLNEEAFEAQHLDNIKWSGQAKFGNFDPILQEGFRDIPRIMGKLVRGTEKLSDDELLVWNKYKEQFSDPTTFNESQRIRKQQIDIVEEAQAAARQQDVAPIVRETAEDAVPEPTLGAALVDPPRIPGTRNSEEWAKLYKDEYGIEIIDPDGWRGDTPAFFNRAWAQKITQKTFEYRLARSTQQRRRAPTVEPGPTPVVAPVGREVIDEDVAAALGDVGAEVAPDVVAPTTPTDAYVDAANVALGQQAEQAIPSPQFFDDPVNFTKSVPDPDGKIAKAHDAARGGGGGVPDDLDDLFDDLGAPRDENVAAFKLPDETDIQAIMRRHEGLVNQAIAMLEEGVTAGNRLLREAGLTVSYRGKEVLREEALPKIDALYRRLHDPSMPIPGDTPDERALFQRMYDLLREQTDIEQAMRMDYDPKMAQVQDYFYRGWRMGRDLAEAFKRGTLTRVPAYQRLRNNATYDQMREAGFEPYSWNPFEQVRVSRIQGIRNRQQRALLNHLMRAGLAKPIALVRKEGVQPGWRVPQVGSMFEGVPSAIPDPELGGMKAVRAGQWMVDPDVARRLENIYGVGPDLKTINVAGRELDLMKMIDAVVFIPKRVKLFGSFFQQIDFTSRNVYGTWMTMVDGMIDGLRAGDLPRAVRSLKAGASIPRDALDIIRANFSPGYRTHVRAEFLSKAPLVEGRPGIHMFGMVGQGLSYRDVTIGINDVIKTVIDEGALRGIRGAGHLIVQLESAMRRGLFDGVYPAAILRDVKNNIVHQVVKSHPNYTDEQINAAVAKIANIKYSTIPASQSYFQNPAARAFLQRAFFSVGESEGLLKQGIGAIRGEHKALWRKHWLAVYLSLIMTANAIHFASTGKPLPADRYVPLSRDHYSLLPVGYRTDFASPTIPIRGRNDTELTLDLAGQMDTVFRILDPGAFFASRESVPVRAGWNQITGRDFFGAPIDEVGPGGIMSRTAAAIRDLFAPIGFGQAGADILRETVPAVEKLLPPGEERLGVVGQFAQMPGLNVRAESTPQLMDRIARESGYLIQAPDERAGEPVKTWDDMTPRQQQEATAASGYSEELDQRTEVSAQRGSAGAQQRLARTELDQQYVVRANRIATKYLSGSFDSGVWKPRTARSELATADQKRMIEMQALYGDREDVEPPEGTTAHLLWEYYNIFDMATENGALNFDVVEDAQQEMYSRLTEQEFDWLMDNIRVAETNLNPTIQKMKNAGRYVSSVQVSVQGVPIKYWDIDKHPMVVTALVSQGFNRRRVEEYVNASHLTRGDLSRSGGEVAKFSAIEQALYKLKDEGQLVNQLKNEFYSTVPSEWIETMVVWGYTFTGDDDARDAMHSWLKTTGNSLPDRPYKEMASQALKDAA